MSEHQATRFISSKANPCRLCLICFIFLLTITSNAQSSYIILNNQDTLRGSLQKELSPFGFDILIETKQGSKKFTADEVTAIFFDKNLRFESFPVFRLEKSIRVFMECLILGEISLYMYSDEQLDQSFFLKTKEGEIRPLQRLIEERRNAQGNRYIKDVKYYIGELKVALADCNQKKLSQDIDRSTLSRKSLTKVLLDYYSCANKPYSYAAPYERKRKTELNLALMVGVNNFKDVKSGFINGYNVGFNIQYPIPKSEGRYSIDAGLILSTGENNVNAESRYEFIPLRLNRYLKISDQYAIKMRAGIDYLLIEGISTVGYVVGIGQEYQLGNSRLKLINHLDYRWLGLTALNFNIGIRY